MNQIAIRVALVLFLVVVYALAEQQSEKKQAFAVYDGVCLADVSRKPATRVLAPFEDGKPNLKKARLLNPAVTINPDCYRIEIH